MADRTTEEETMTRGMLSYQARRHPFLTGIAMIVLGPYILAFLLLFVALFAVAALLDLVVTRR